MTDTSELATRRKFTLISFGYGHKDNPAATKTGDVRTLFRDPHFRPEMRYMTARDEAVRANVIRQDGAVEYVREFAAELVDEAVTGEPVIGAIGCTGGRHRAPSLIEEVATVLREAGHQVEVVHRHIDLPVIERQAGA